MNPSIPTRSLEERIQRLEDHLAIYQLIAAYGPSADACNIDNIEKLWHADCVYDIGGIGAFHGHAGMKALFEGELHQGIVRPGSGHVSTMPVVVIEGDRATATHHGMLLLYRDGGIQPTRLIASTWQLVRTPGQGLGWQVLRRTNRVLDGQPAAREVLSKALAGPGTNWCAEACAHAPQAGATATSTASTPQP